MDYFNAHNYGQMAGKLSIDEFEAESIDERHVADFDGKLTAWWCQFWRSFAASVAIGAKSNVKHY